MSKDDLVYLSMKNIDKPLKFFKANEHSVFCEVTWEDFFKEALALKHIESGDIEQQTVLILSLLLGIRHYEVLLGMREVPTTQERHQIILSSIQLFLMKYQLNSG